MASDFTLQIICRIHQIRYSKRPLFRVTSLKNDTIGYATLIAPVISSKIKPGIFISLLYAHMGIHCVENLYYYTHKCCHCSVTGYPPVKPHAAIKGGWEAEPEAPSVWSHGLLLISPSWNLHSIFQQKMLEENLPVTREIPATSSCNPNALIGSILDIMSLHIPMRQL